MAKSLSGYQVPDELFRQANGILARGGKAYICFPEGGGLGSCDNCEGCGHLILQHVTGGPFDSPPGPKGDSTATFIEGNWYLIENDQFSCPMCRGTGNKPQTKAKKRKVLF